MITKELTPSANKRRATSAPIRDAGQSNKPTKSVPILELSFDVEPVMSVVRRHVQLSKEADEAITLDLAQMLSQAIVQMRATENKSTTGQVHSKRSDPVLTTEQAAQLVGVSRPYMAKVIDSGAIDLHQKVGNQRRVLKSAVTRWQKLERARQTKALKRLARDLDEEIFSS
jgi:excisionase family DNA binding protein